MISMVGAKDKEFQLQTRELEVKVFIKRLLQKC